MQQTYSIHSQGKIAAKKKAFAPLTKLNQYPSFVPVQELTGASEQELTVSEVHPKVEAAYWNAYV